MAFELTNFWIPVGHAWTALALFAMAAGCAGKAERDDEEDSYGPYQPRIESDLDGSLVLSDLSAEETLVYCEDVRTFGMNTVPESMACRLPGFSAALDAVELGEDPTAACENAYDPCLVETRNTFETACDGATYQGCPATVSDGLACNAALITELRAALSDLPSCEEIEAYLAEPWPIERRETPAECVDLDATCREFP